MADTQQHTPPGGWPWSKGKDATDSKDAPPEYFDDKKKSLDSKSADGKSDVGKKAGKQVEEPEQEWVEDNSVAGDTQKPTSQEDGVEKTKDVSNEVSDAAKDGVEVTKEPEEMDSNPLDDLKAGLQQGNDNSDLDHLKNAEIESLTDEEKKKLTPGGGLDSVKTDKVDDAADTAQDKAGVDTEDAEKKVDDTTNTSTTKVDDATDTKHAGDELNETKDAAEDKVGETKDDTEEKVGEAKDAAEDKLDDTDDAAKDATETDLPERPKEGEDTDVKDAEIPKEGEDVVEGAKDSELPREGEDAVDDTNDKLPEGEDAVDDTKDKLPEGEELTKEGDEVAKEGDDAVKEGEETVEDELDLSIMKGGKVNKGGNVVNEEGKVVGRIKEGVLKHLVGKRVDEKGVIWSDSGKVLGQAELIPEDERDDMDKDTAPFEAFPDATVDGEGYVVFEGDRVGKVVDGDIKSLRGLKVDQDGEILDRKGNVVGRAERWEPEAEAEPEPEAPVDRSILAGKRVNKAGNVVDSHGSIFGKVIEGDVKRMVGRMCDKEGLVRSESGDVLGRAEVVPEGEREGVKEGPFAELSGCTVTKDGKVVTPGGDIVGRLTQGDGKKLFGRLVDDDGDILDANGNVLGKAERWEEPEVEKKKNPLSGRRVNKKGEVVDEDGNLIGKLTSGDLSICSGKEIDDDGDVVDGKGTTIGHVSLLEDIPDEAPTESAEDKEKRERAEQDKKLAQQMAYCLTQCLDKVKPICSMINSKIEKAERTPKEELNEEELVKEVRPLIEEGGKILQEANGIIRGLDPDGRIQANAKHNTAKREATPEEYHLADILKELTGTVTKCIEDAKKKLEGMPHAKKELNPLWGLLSEPLFQILAAVGLLLNGVLGLVGRLLSGLGLGGLVDSLLGGLGVKNILSALGVGGLTDALTGKKKGEKKSGGGGLLGLGG